MTAPRKRKSRAPARKKGAARKAATKKKTTRKAATKKKTTRKAATRKKTTPKRKPARKKTTRPAVKNAPKIQPVAGPGVDAGDAYARHRSQAAVRQRQISAGGREIGPIPPIANPERRAAGEGGLRTFAEQYFPHRFTLDWGEDHLALIEDLEATITEGGKRAFALPRGSGKTSIVEVAAMWAVSTGRRRFVVVIGATREAALDILDSISSEYETNDTLAEDYPEICLPIRALEGIVNRSKGQQCMGQPTRIGWSGMRRVLPSVEGSRASGSIIATRGITGALRGLKHHTGDGDTIRPDQVILDDIQTDTSARSPGQVAKRLSILGSAVMGLAGPGQKIAAMLAGTVMARDDAMHQLLDQTKWPDWSGRRCPMVYAFPTETKLWDQYADLRREDLRRKTSHATEMYAANRAAMDAGGRVYWEARKFPEELSAIQHAMNLRIDDPATFDAEFQNEPPDLAEPGLALPSATAIADRGNGLAAGVVPAYASNVAVMIDCQQACLYYGVGAFSRDFRGSVIRHSTWPDQGRNYFTLREVQRTLAAAAPKGAQIEGALYHGLMRLIEELATTSWKREDGTELRTGLILVDSGWQTDTVQQVCRETPHASIVLPSQGKAVGAHQRPMTEYQKRPGEELGLNWLIGVPFKKAQRQVSFDTNWWKTSLFERLAAPPGEPGALVFNGKPLQLRMIADHLTAESRTAVVNESTGRRVEVWSQKPGHDNHFLDVLVGLCVAASMLGCAFDGSAPKPRRQKRKITRDNLPDHVRYRRR